MTQENRILTHLMRRGTITPLEALNKYGCFRLAARIYSIKKYLPKGNRIETAVIEKNGKYFAKYILK